MNSRCTHGTSVPQKPDAEVWFRVCIDALHTGHVSDPRKNSWKQIQTLADLSVPARSLVGMVGSELDGSCPSQGTGKKMQKARATQRMRDRRNLRTIFKL